MSRALLLSLVIFAVLAAGLASLEGRLLALLMPLLAYLGAAMLAMPETVPVRAQRDVHPGAVQEGEPATVRVTLNNERESVAVLQVTDSLPGGLKFFGRSAALGKVGRSTAALVTTLAAGATVVLDYAVTAQRGAFEFQSVTVTVSETLGLFQRKARVPAYGRLIAVPRAGRLRSLAIRPRRTLGFAGPIPSRQSGVGVDFFGVRDFQAGDPLRRVNWRGMTRRPDRPTTVEFEQERTADVGLILDVRRESAFEMESVSLLEYGVQATAAVADSLLGDGHRVGLLLYGRGIEWVFPGYGRVQRERILRALATAGPGDSQVFATLDFFPARLFLPRSQLIFISPLLRDDQRMLLRLRALGYAVVVVSPNPVVYEAANLQETPLLSLAVRWATLERRVMLQQLRQGGIPVADWHLDDALDSAIQVAVATARRGVMVARGAR